MDYHDAVAYLWNVCGIIIMSKNIIIQENGVEQVLSTISKVNTTRDGGGSADWVPEDETTLGQLTVNTNDTSIKARAQGYYGFSVVKVKASGRAVGKNKNGQWKVVTADSSGHFVEHDLPIRIAVVTLPTKTAYEAGEDIVLDGMVVRAYYSDDSEYGLVPSREITVTPTKATSTTITVEWLRIGDKQELTTTFNITVD